MVTLADFASNYKAFCYELNRNVEATEIWDMMYGESPVSYNLTFKCPDPLCDARLITRNCFPYAEPEAASFRLYPRSKHVYECTYHSMKRPAKKKIDTHISIISSSLKTKRAISPWL